MLKTKFREILPLLYASCLWPLMFVLYEYVGIKSGYPLYFAAWLVAIASFFVVKAFISWILFDSRYVAPCQRMSAITVFREFESFTSGYVLACLGWMLTAVFAGSLTLFPGAYNDDSFFGGMFILLAIISLVFSVLAYVGITVAENRANRFIRDLGIIVPNEED